jgi:hypothetical protein
MEALRDFYLSTNGNMWYNNNNWPDFFNNSVNIHDHDPCKELWYGVSCSNNHTSTLSLPRNNVEVFITNCKLFNFTYFRVLFQPILAICTGYKY